MYRIFSLTIIFIIITNCGYQPIFSSNNSKFSIGKITTIGDKKLNKILVKQLENYKLFNNKSKVYNLTIRTNTIKQITSKDTKGNPKTYKFEIVNEIEVYNKNKLLFTKKFIKNKNYNNIESKFDLKKYENNLLNNLVKKNIEDIVMFLESI